MTDNNVSTTTPATTGATAFGSHYIGTRDRCQRMGFLSFLAPHPKGGNGLRTKLPPGPVKLGGIVHEGIAAYYLSGPEDHTKRDVDYAVAKLEAAAAARANDWATSEEREVDLTKGRALLYDYHHHWRGDPDVLILSDKDGPLVEREWAIEIPGCPNPFTCRPDAIAKWRDWVYVLEHKTTTAYGVSLLRTSMRNNIQGTGECYVISKVLPHLPIQGVLLNILLKDRSSKSKYSPFERDTCARTPAQLAMFEAGVRARHQHWARQEAEWTQLTKELGDPWLAAQQVYAATGASTGACENQFGRPCEFLEMCVGVGMEPILSQGYVARREELPSGGGDE